MSKNRRMCMKFDVKFEQHLCDKLQLVAATDFSILKSLISQACSEECFLVRLMLGQSRESIHSAMRDLSYFDGNKKTTPKKSP